MNESKIIPKRLWQRNDGLSLVELMVATVVMTIVMSGALSAITSIQKLSIESVRQHDYQDLHSLNLIRLENFRYVKDNIFPATPALLDCFAADSSGCKAFEAHGKPIEPNRLAQCPTITPQCFFSSSLTYDIDCTDRLCRGVNFTLTTTDRTPEFNPNARPRTPKVSHLSVPGMMFVGRKGIDYSCGAGQLLHSIDYDKNKAFCRDVSGAACGGSLEPLRSVGAGGCEPLENKDCANGLHSIGLFQGQSSCTQPVEEGSKNECGAMVYASCTLGPALNGQTVSSPCGPPAAAGQCTGSCSSGSWVNLSNNCQGPATWVTGGWSKCSGSCSAPDGQQTRTVECQAIDGTPSNACDVAAKPPDVQNCKAPCQQIIIYSRQEDNCSKCYCVHDVPASDGTYSCGNFDLKHKDDNMNQCKKQITKNIIPAYYPGYRVVSQTSVSMSAGKAAPNGCTRGDAYTLITTVLEPL